MNLEEAIKSIIFCARLSANEDVKKSLAKVEPALESVPHIKAKVQDCIDGEISYDSLLVWLNEKFNI